MARTELVRLPGGVFSMGSDAYYPEEGPRHERTVAAFAIERHPVTNRQFAEFVAATGHVTIAERSPDPAEFPGADPADLVPGALVFTPTTGPVDLRDWRQWWRWVPGASWRHPQGPDSGIEDKPDHPVVQIAHDDASAYAAWVGRRLPTEAEWEYAARGGSTEGEYAWGSELAPGGVALANTWWGDFPYRSDGWGGTSPVGSYPANGFGLVDMIGNVWERTADPFAGSHLRPVDPAGRPDLLADRPPSQVMRVTKGGSFICSPQYCARYRPAARSAQSDDTATSHLGFRCVG